jgi:hypothetical protein
MDDKILAQIYATLAQVGLAIEDVLRTLELAGVTATEDSTSMLHKIQANRELREAASKEYMSGRWVRRDGDSYGPAPKPAIVPFGDASANRKTGDL